MFEVMRPLEHGERLTEIALMNATKRMENITDARPAPFHCIAMDFAHPIAIIVPGPLPRPCRMADGGVESPGPSKVVICLPLIGVNRGV